MSQARLDGKFFFAMGAAIFLLLGCLWKAPHISRMGDFKAVRYASQALIHDHDPYSEPVLHRIYTTAPENRMLAAVPLIRLHWATRCINLPTTLVLFVPLALLPWSVAHLLWGILIATSILLATYLVWELGSAWSPRASGVLILLFLTAGQIVLEIGNTAGVVIGLCVIGALCLIRQRYIPVGILLLALALVLKPQDAGFVWLYFLLAGGNHRRRALQTLVVVAAIAIPSVIWVHEVSPHWAQELHSNLVHDSYPGEINDPAGFSVDPAVHGAMNVSLQTVVGVFTCDPHVYNPLAYLLCAPFILLWGMAVLRTPPSIERDWLALAAIVPFSMLVCYHRQYDTLLIILAIPACAMLWAERKREGKLALILTLLTGLASSNFILELFGSLTYHLRESTNGLGGELLNAALARPVPLAMLMQGIFLSLFFARRAFVLAPPASPFFSELIRGFVGTECACLQSPAHALRNAGD